MKDKNFLFGFYIFGMVALIFTLFQVIPSGSAIWFTKNIIGFPLLLFFDFTSMGSVSILLYILAFLASWLLQYALIVTVYELIRDGFKLKTGID